MVSIVFYNFLKIVSSFSLIEAALTKVIMEKWSGKIAVVTGGSSGIGAEIVKDLARNGLIVIGLARRNEKVEEIAENLGNVTGKIHVKKCDISDLNSVKETFKWIEENFGTINILINNASVAYSIKILDESDETTERLIQTIDTNLTGMVNVTREAVRLIKKSDDYGMVISINDICGHFLPTLEEESMNVYAPTKFALTAFSEVLRQELILQRNEKIRVSCVNPGTVKTEELEPEDFFEDGENYFDENPFLGPEDISNGVLFLLETNYNVNITQLTIRPVGEKL